MRKPSCDRGCGAHTTAQRDLLRARVILACTASHSAETVATRYPAGTVYIVWDNLNIHYDGKPDRWTHFNERHGHRFVFVYTPTHASWVN